MRVLFVSAEMFPLAKTGGLGDVAAALPEALVGLGLDMRVLIPGYRQALALAKGARAIADLSRLLGVGPARLLEWRAEAHGATVWLLDCPSLFDRDGGLYQDRAGRDWPDNARRFGLLSKAAALVALGDAGLSWQPDLVHANDWHAGLVPLYLKIADRPAPASLFAIHNLAYQGGYDFAELAGLGLPERLYNPGGIEFYGRASLLKAGVVFADRLVTVSPSYAREILTPEFGFGFDGLLRARADRLCGILNGVDGGVWDPAGDPLLPRLYGANDLAGKAACKALVQHELGLKKEPDRPLIGFVSRLAHQKMADVMAGALSRLVAAGAQIVVHGQGEREYEHGLLQAAASLAGKAAVCVGYDEGLAHRVIAGADLVLVPARYEPCGLVQLYGLRYGSLPIVRRTGGLADTVVDADHRALIADRATGFVFEHAEADAMVAAAGRALALYREPVTWRRLQRRAMAQDFGWRRSARAYGGLYDQMAPAARPLALAAFEDRTIPAQRDQSRASA